MPPQITVIPFVVPMIGNAGDALGYGIGAPSGLGVLTPYTGLTLVFDSIDGGAETNI